MKSAVLPEVHRHLRALGQAIRGRRLARQWTVVHLSVKAGSSPATIKRIEQGDPSVSMGHWAGCLDALDTLDKVSEAASIAKDTATLALQATQLRARGLRRDKKQYDF